MIFARRTFLIAGIYGLIVLLPLYFLEERIGRDLPPAITHPEYYYGFVGVAVVWQIAYLVISRDPSRYRPFMILGAIAKASFAVAVAVLFAVGRADAYTLISASMDLVFGAFFLAAYSRTPAQMAER